MRGCNSPSPRPCLRGVKVEIVIPEHCNYLVMDWAMRAHLRFFSHIAVNIYTTPLPFDHSKLCTVDGDWCLIGSSNWDARSFRLNFEFDLECYDPELTQKLDAIIDAKIARATRLDREGADPAAHPHPPARCGGAADDAVFIRTDY